MTDFRAANARPIRPLTRRTNMHPTTDANVPATATNETPLEPAKRTKTASVARVAVIDEMVDGLPAQQYSPGNRAVMRKIVRRLMVLENFGE